MKKNQQIMIILFRKILQANGMISMIINDNNNDYSPKKTLTQKNNFNFGIFFKFFQIKKSKLNYQRN
jgi:hypothetical protein